MQENSTIQVCSMGKRRHLQFGTGHYTKLPQGLSLIFGYLLHASPLPSIHPFFEHLSTSRKSQHHNNQIHLIVNSSRRSLTWTKYRINWYGKSYLGIEPPPTKTTTAEAKNTKNKKYKIKKIRGNRFFRVNF